MILLPLSSTLDSSCITHAKEIRLTADLFRYCYSVFVRTATYLNWMFTTGDGSDGSVNDNLNAFPALSISLMGGALRVAHYGTSVTVIVWLAVPVPPSLSVAFSVTTYVPLASGVKLKLLFVPEANAPPFLVTLHA